MSKLDTYIQTLLSDDFALSKFVQNPLVADYLDGLTKAERAVLRRVVMHLPPTAKSGFSARSMASFRRSLRLIQNVLHYSSTAIHANALSATSDVEATVLPEAISQDGVTPSQNGGIFHLYVYYPNGGSNNYTYKTNADVQLNGGPYANYRYFQIVFGDGPTSVERLLLGASQAFPNDISYLTVTDPKNNLPYVSEITINGNMITANLLDYNLYEDFVFWFYSINGRPNKANQGGDTGTVAESFTDFYLTSGDTVFWQLIAPDADYGFQPCPTQKPMTFMEADDLLMTIPVK